MAKTKHSLSEEEIEFLADYAKDRWLEAGHAIRSAATTTNEDAKANHLGYAEDLKKLARTLNKLLDDVGARTWIFKE